MKPEKLPKLAPLLGPRHWPFWLIIIILRCLIVLPYRCQLFIGEKIGKVIYHLAKKARLTAEVNIKLCFPELTEKQHQRLVKQSFQSAGIALFEIAMGWWASDKRLASLMHIHDFEHFRNALTQGKGSIILGTHFGCLHIAGRMFTQKMQLAVVYRRQKIKVFDYVALHAYHKHFQRAIVREDLRAMIRALKDNLPVWFTPDIDPKNKASIFAPFFGIPAATVVIPAKFAMKTGAKVMATGYYRRDDGKGYDIFGYPFLEDFPSGDLYNDTKRINEVLESIIRKKPEQYIWQYKRFNTRPGGEVNPYKLAEQQQ